MKGLPALALLVIGLAAWWVCAPSKRAEAAPDYPTFAQVQFAFDQDRTVIMALTARVVALEAKNKGKRK